MTTLTFTTDVENPLVAPPAYSIIEGPACRAHVLPGARMVACIDGSAGSPAAIRAASYWAMREGVPLWILSVLPPPGLESRLGPGHADWGPGWEVLRSESPGEAIVSYANSEPVGLIALTAHGDGDPKSAPLGPVASYVIEHAPCPVLLMRP
jgi:hypothetical protein